MRFWRVEFRALDAPAASALTRESVHIMPEHGLTIEELSKMEKLTGIRMDLVVGY
jgi:hypothetical protein